jgi:hypothetical protein
LPADKELEFYKQKLMQRDNIIKDLNNRIANIASPRIQKNIPATIKFEDIYSEMDLTNVKNKCVHLLTQSNEMKKEIKDLKLKEKEHSRTVE